jgi:hypothetical protein
LALIPPPPPPVVFDLSAGGFSVCVAKIGRELLILFSHSLQLVYQHVSLQPQLVALNKNKVLFLY